MDESEQEFGAQERLGARVLALLPPTVQSPPSVTELLQRAEASHLDVRDWAVLPATGAEKWKASIDVFWPAEETADEGVRERWQYEVWLERVGSIDDWHFEGRGLTLEEQQGAAEAVWGVGVGVELGERPLEEFHRLLRVAAAIADDAPAFLDVSSCALHAGSWVRENARSQSPPHPRNLFTVHAVRSEAAPGSVWLHTHGLLRCGSVEFEFIDAPADRINEALELLQTVCVSAIERGSGPPATIFEPGEDIAIAWVPWPDAMRSLTGRLGARPEDRDDYHRLPSGVLVEQRGVWPFRRLASPRRALEIMSRNPVLFVSNMETRRMERLALERFHLFRRAFEQHGKSEGWNFFIKLGYPVAVEEKGEEEGGENATAPTAGAAREHLWFRCEELGDGNVYAELLNDPHHLPKMARGQRDWHELARLTDWTIQTPERPYDPDTVVTMPEA